MQNTNDFENAQFYIYKKTNGKKDSFIYHILAPMNLISEHNNFSAFVQCLDSFPFEPSLKKHYSDLLQKNLINDGDSMDLSSRDFSDLIGKIILGSQGMSKFNVYNGIPIIPNFTNPNVRSVFMDKKVSKDSIIYEEGNIIPRMSEFISPNVNSVFMDKKVSKDSIIVPNLYIGDEYIGKTRLSRNAIYPITLITYANSDIVFENFSEEEMKGFPEKIQRNLVTLL